MKKALIIVDVQNDFVEGGSLAVSGGTDLAARLAEMVRGDHDYDIIVTTQDWHINPGTHFSDTPDFVDTWPVHCVAGEFGSRIVKSLAESIGELVVNDDIDYVRILKGQYKAAYSGFEGEVINNGDSLNDDLKIAGITTVDVVGIATDYCVKATATDAVANGFETTVLKDFCVGINADNCNELFTTGFADLGINVK